MEQPKRKFPRSILILAIIAAVFGFGTGIIIILTRPMQNATGFALPTSVTRSLALNKPAPDFTLNTLDGKPFTLQETRGKRVLINFWAAWCPPCLSETPDLVSAYDELRDAGVVFIGIGTQDETAKLKAFVDDKKVPYIILDDGDGKIGDRYAVLGLPTTVLIDSSGIVRKIFTGAVTRQQVIDEMKKLN